MQLYHRVDILPTNDAQSATAIVETVPLPGQAIMVNLTQLKLGERAFSSVQIATQTSDSYIELTRKCNLPTGTDCARTLEVLMVSESFVRLLVEFIGRVAQEMNIGDPFAIQATQEIIRQASVSKPDPARDQTEPGNPA